MQTMIDELLSSLPSISALLFVLAGLSLLFGAKFFFKRLLIFGVIAALLSGIAPRSLEVFGQWMGGLPVWLLILVGGFTLLGIFGAFASIFIGRHAANSMVGALAAQLVRMVIAIVIFPVRGLQRLSRGYFGEP